MIVAAPLAQACDYPARPPKPPNGVTASNDEMVAGLKFISDYQSSMNEYLDCIEANEVVASDTQGDDDSETTQQRQKMFNMKYDAAIDELTLVVEEFNVQIREYKAR